MSGLENIKAINKNIHIKLSVQTLFRFAQKKDFPAIAHPYGGKGFMYHNNVFVASSAPSTSINHVTNIL